jgi:MoaA/NifB/PqqE/SkfB family radical SAM enzyme
MKPNTDVPPPIFKIHSGWRLRLQQALFAFSAIKYLRRNRYPLFTISGCIKTYRLGRVLKLHKLVQLNDKHFTVPVLPCYPSSAFDHMVKGGGLNISAAGTPLKSQISMILLGITRNCSLRCLHCYERFNISSENNVPVSRWKEVIREIQNVGAGVIVLSGGEPMQQYDRLLELLQSGDKNRSEFHLHTSGQGVTRERALELHGNGLTAAAVGLDDVDEQRHDSLRGFQGSHRQAIRALRDFHDAGIFTYTNLCLTKEIINNGSLWDYFELAKSLKVGFIEMLEPRPCGGYAFSDDGVMLTSEERKKATQFFIEGNTRGRYGEYPLIYYVGYIESPGHMGCMMGGLSHMTIDSKGNVNPCVFLPVAFGNIMEEDFGSIYKRMRERIPRPVHAECPSVSLAHVLRTRYEDLGIWPIPFDAVIKEWDAIMKC